MAERRLTLWVRVVEYAEKNHTPDLQPFIEAEWRVFAPPPPASALPPSARFRWSI